MKKLVLLALLSLITMSCLVHKNSMTSIRKYNRNITENDLPTDIKFSKKQFQRSNDMMWEKCLSTLKNLNATIVTTFKDEKKITARFKRDFIVIWIEKTKDSNSSDIYVKSFPKLSAYFYVEVSEEEFFNVLSKELN